MSPEPDIKPAIEPVDRGESNASFEPMLIAEGSRHRTPLLDKAIELAERSAGFRRSLPASIVGALADLVRSMNCYYSNLIEGHDTHPVDIERALKDDLSADAKKRDLQLEARAHIEVQAWIDAGGLAGAATTAEGVREIHRRFCERLPDELLMVEGAAPGERIRLEPGRWRTRDVKVGRHVAISPGAVPRAMARFEEAYGRLGRTDRLLSVAAAHHRLLWIHPFMDGNGRVARLLSHAMLLDTLDTGAIWSVARGLARREAEYKARLAACDLPPRNALDGRGALSEEELAAFTGFFLDVCLDQVRFMESLMQPDRLRDRLRDRVLGWVGEEARRSDLPAKAGAVVEAILYRGELPRADVPGLVGTTERQARRIVAALAERGVVAADSHKAPLRLAFPAALAAAWMPGLFPEKAA